jgi:hypothetical protein
VLDVLNRLNAAQTGGHVNTNTLASMENQIRAVGGNKISHHGSDTKILNVFDVSPNSIES